MKIVTKYVSEDNREFLNAQECHNYEELCECVDKVMAQLIPKPEGTSFSNGDGYIQQDPAVLKSVKRDLLTLANEIMPHEWFQQSISDETIHPSWAGRLIGEMNERCLNSAWYRIMCIGPECREYGQPYYANHPEEAKGPCLNKEQS